MTYLDRFSPSDDPEVIVASSDPRLREAILQQFHIHSIPVLEAMGGADALGKLGSTECTLLVLDRKLADLSVEDVLGSVKDQFPGIDVLLLDEAGQLAPAAKTREWRSASAQHVYETISRWNSHAASAEVQPEVEPIEHLPGMIGSSGPMLRVARMARLVAAHTTPVLITGATGTGKEVVAKAIHRLSPRANKPFVVINCAAIPEALLEAELFGYVRGAFTGAVQSQMGRVQSAQGGTVFLDEIGEMPLGMQAKLLRFLDQGEIQRLGSADLVRVDVRLIAATNANLSELARQHQFRSDLFYRLSVFPIELPQLNERSGDIECLARHFLRKFSPEAGERALSLQAISLLQQHAWPGNVRELQHVMERASIIAEGSTIQPEHLGLSPICD